MAKKQYKNLINTIDKAGVYSIEEITKKEAMEATQGKGNTAKTGNKAFDDDYNRFKKDLHTEIFLKINTIFRWKNLPSEIKSTFPEQLLNDKGSFLAFNYLDCPMIAPFAESGNITEYDTLNEATPISSNGFQYPKMCVSPYPYTDNDGNFKIKQPEAVIVKNNLLGLPTMPMVEKYIESAAFILASLMEQIRASKFHGYIKAKNPSAGADAQDAVYNITGLILPVIDTVEGTKDKIIEDLLEVVQITGKMDISTIQTIYDKMINLIDERLGIKTLPDNGKKERLLDKEITSNNERTALNYEVFKSARDEGLERIHQYLGEKWQAVEVVSVYDEYIEDMNELEDDESKDDDNAEATLKQDEEIQK